MSFLNSDEFKEIFGYGSVFLYFYTYFFFSGKIFQSKRFWIKISVLIFISITLIVTFKLNQKHLYAALSTIWIFYSLALIAIKLAYKKLNDFCIKNKLIETYFSKKDFTFTPTKYVTLNKDKQSTSSTLDFILSALLLLIPFFLALQFMP